MVDPESARQSVALFQSLLDKTPESAWHVRVGPDAWTLAEIVGHLIDSASNNHQRFARLRFGDLEGFPGYDAEPWVQAQGYDSCDARQLCALWSAYNGLLLHLAETMPGNVAGNVWRTNGEALSLEFLVNDYYAHLRLHTRQYEERLSEVFGADS